MTFEPRIAEARLALNLISSMEMPKLAWEGHPQVVLHADLGGIFDFLARSV